MMNFAGAAACNGDGANRVAGIRDGNHCYCGSKAGLSTAAAKGLSRPMIECLVPVERCPCGGAKTRGCSCRCSGNFSESCGGTARLLAFSFACKPLQ